MPADTFTLVCDCGEEQTVTGASADSSCPCGADHSVFIEDIRARESQLRDVVAHPWNYEVKEQAAQHLRDEAAYPEGFPQRYEDIKSGRGGVDEERWKKARAQQNRASFEGH